MAIIVMPQINFSFEDMVRADYIAGKIDIEQFEAEIEILLRGELVQRLFGGLPPAA